MTLTLVRQPDVTVSDEVAHDAVAGQPQPAMELVPLGASDVARKPDVQTSQTVVSSGLLGRLRGVGSDLGMTTAEYAIGTVAACGFGGVLIKLLTSDTVVKLLSDLIRKALTLAF